MHYWNLALSLSTHDRSIRFSFPFMLKLLSGECFSRLQELKIRLKSFFEKIKTNLHVQFRNEKFVVMLAYLADVFSHLNDMNLYLQTRVVTVSDVKNKLAGLTTQM